MLGKTRIASFVVSQRNRSFISEEFLIKEEQERKEEERRSERDLRELFLPSLVCWCGNQTNAVTLKQCYCWPSLSITAANRCLRSDRFFIPIQLLLPAPACMSRVKGHTKHMLNVSDKRKQGRQRQHS